MRGAVFVAASVFFVSLRADAALRIKWDCYLPNTSLDCAVIHSSLTSKIPFITTVSSERDADVVVELTSVPAEDAMRIRLDFRGRPIDGYVATVHTSDKIPTSIDPSTALVRVMTKLERGLADFMDQKEAAEVHQGKLSLVLSDPTDLPFRGRPEQTSKKWYLTPALGSYFSDVVGVGINASGTASVSFNESQANWRVQQAIAASYLQESQPVPSTKDTATVSFIGASAVNVLSRDLTADHRFGVALLLGAEKNPQANYRLRANGSIGLEYDLVPRETANQRNFGLRCAIGPEYQHYDTTNIEGLDQQVVPRELCDVYFTWHFQPIDLAATVSENVVLKSADYASFSAVLAATWRVTDNFLISPWVSIQEIVKAIDEAQSMNVSYTDPKSEIEESMRAAVQQGYTAPFGVQSGLTIKYVFGNGSLASEDQRWRGVTSLR
ncbi:MAG TPA: DUF481 domain-containing protein [Polyangiaceae bacterium]|jgi:hypothetical protein